MAQSSPMPAINAEDGGIRTSLRRRSVMVLSDCSARAGKPQSNTGPNMVEPITRLVRQFVTSHTQRASGFIWRSFQEKVCERKRNSEMVQRCQGLRLYSA